MIIYIATGIFCDGGNYALSVHSTYERAESEIEAYKREDYKFDYYTVEVQKLDETIE